MMMVYALLAGVDRQEVPDCQADMLEGTLWLPRMKLWDNQEEGELFTGRAIHRGLDCPPSWKLPVSPASFSVSRHLGSCPEHVESDSSPQSPFRSCLSTETHLKAEMIEKCRRHVPSEIHAPRPWHQAFWTQRRGPVFTPARG